MSTPVTPRSMAAGTVAMAPGTVAAPAGAAVTAGAVGGVSSVAGR
jgi:hypothetical protein